MEKKTFQHVSGENIRSLRLLKRFKQSLAAKKLGITQQAYSKLEASAAVSESKIIEILTAFDSNEKELEMMIEITPPPPIIFDNFF